MEKLVYWFEEGGLLMWPLLACSLVAVAVILERCWRLRRSAVLDPAVVEDVQSLVEQGKAGQAVERYRNSPVLVGRLLSNALEQHRTAGVDVETALTETGNRGLASLGDNLAVLTLIAKIAPLLGLLGTVQGMILGFEYLEHTAVEKKALAHAIRVALVTTFAGLSIAIPTVIAVSYFRSRIRALLGEFEQVFLAVARTVKSAPAAPEPARTPSPTQAQSQSQGVAPEGRYA